MLPRVLLRSVSDHDSIVRVVAMDPTLPSMPIMMEVGSRDMFDVVHDVNISVSTKIRQARTAKKRKTTHTHTFCFVPLLFIHTGVYLVPGTWYLLIISITGDHPGGSSG